MKILAWSASEMPMPVSATAISTEPCRRRAVIVTVPPSGVNLMALDTRFRSICLSLPASASTSPTDDASERMVMCFVEALEAEKHISFRSAASSVGEVLADAGKLKQMLLNLVSNAIKFTPEGGTVTITARRLQGSVEIAVADTGIGISVADQAKIFMEFHQVDPGPGRRQQGTGLGLALTRRFALLHGGDVRVTSRLGAGSVFTLRLPLQAAAVAPAEEKVDGAAAA